MINEMFLKKIHFQLQKNKKKHGCILDFLNLLKQTQGECLSTCFWLCSVSSYTSFGMNTYPLGLIVMYVFVTDG